MNEEEEQEKEQEGLSKANAVNEEDPERRGGRERGGEGECDKQQVTQGRRERTPQRERGAGDERARASARTHTIASGAVNRIQTPGVRARAQWI